ncbi:MULTISPECIES: SpoIIE family protein phosphatase [unclassified Actinotalea]|uniref:SpoIIE family protein phosphatase n=1 Tax=unclassified Actinotalea TaxID=2638618 RepID=UPI0015F63B3B|nr:MULTISPECIES: SpoIIE family protein phosphatase [unclassified Actinotalea]
MDPSEVIAELALAAADVGTFEWDLATGQLHWDDRMLRLFGYTRQEFRGSVAQFKARLHPDDRPVVGRTVQRAVDARGEVELDCRVVVPGRAMRWLTVRGHVLSGSDGTPARVLGVGYDSTARRDTEARVARVLESIPTAFVGLDLAARVTYVNAEAERMLGRSRHELAGTALWRAFPDPVAAALQAACDEAVRTGTTGLLEAHLPPPSDRWYEVRAWPHADGLGVSFLDVTARHTAQAVAEDAARRARLTARVTHELAETMDAETAMGRLVQLVVPELADWCVVTLAEFPSDGRAPRRRLRDIATWHADEVARPLVARYATTRLAALADESFPGRALDRREPVAVPAEATERIAAMLRPGEALEALRLLAPESAAALPMRARGRTVGAISLFRGPERAPMSAADLAAAREVAGRAGLALDNARLYRQQRQLAEAFQRSLLTEPPQADHLQVAVRYVPAAEAAKVGGDWYDAFVEPDGATVIVIGDVVGHDGAAAATMSQVRSILRGVAVTCGATPAAVLERVDRALRSLRLDALATAVVATIEQTDDDRGRGLTRVRLSNAGHPTPLVLHPDGSVAALTAGRPDILLGVRPDTERRETVATLERGATLLLYTDGLVERRDRGLREGIALLRRTLGELAPADPETICDQVLARMLPVHADDDVALVAVRLQGSAAPRPARQPTRFSNRVQGG